ncbi:MAG: Spx/MgsR family RNA polymerase-binding regulatory protein [Nitrospirae bacterium]|nr:Spx/MgsR family RNA polymerase-binding regulatory protein [Nitrospirota bacterium]MBI3605128.1 Spx/MgsR family RNA polymerase-binding regulatory protein [Nitrospirota bacterium]
MTLKIYHYAKCQSCVKARKLLVQKKHQLEEIDITTSPPSAQELKSFIKLSGKPYTDFLNRSGVQYREKNMKEWVKKLSEDDIIQMLSKEGRLIKRPIVTDGKKVTVGFNEEAFKKIW